MENLVIERVVNKLNVKKYTLKSRMKKIICYLVNNDTDNIYSTLSNELECDITTIYRNIKTVIENTPEEVLDSLELSSKRTNKEFIEGIVELVKNDIENEKHKKNTI